MTSTGGDCLYSGRLQFLARPSCHRLPCYLTVVPMMYEGLLLLGRRRIMAPVLVHVTSFSRAFLSSIVILVQQCYLQSFPTANDVFVPQTREKSDIY